MKCSVLNTRFNGVARASLAGFTAHEVLQAVITDIYGDDAVARLKAVPPYVATTAGTLTYHFDADNDQGLTAILSGVSSIRRVRGLYKPALTETNLSDYNYRHMQPFDQNVINTRLYDGAIDIDNERRLIVFRSDPGTTTDTWKIDYYEEAPTLDEDDDIPVLPGWEMKLVFPGMRAFAEEWKTGSSDTWRPAYDNMLKAYAAALGVDKNIPRIDDNLYIHKDPIVIAQ